MEEELKGVCNCDPTPVVEETPADEVIPTPPTEVVEQVGNEAEEAEVITTTEPVSE